MSDPQTKKIMGQRIRQARQNRRWSQEELARRLEKDQSSIAHYENGLKAIRSTELPKLAQVLGVSIGYFFGELAAEENINEVIKNLDANNRKSLLDRAEFLLKQQDEITRNKNSDIDVWHLVLPAKDSEEGEVDMYIPRIRGRSVVEEMLQKGWILVDTNET